MSKRTPVEEGIPDEARSLLVARVTRAVVNNVYEKTDPELLEGLERRLGDNYWQYATVTLTAKELAKSFLEVAIDNTTGIDPDSVLFDRLVEKLLTVAFPPDRTPKVKTANA
jgi:hypothetical protein